MGRVKWLFCGSLRKKRSDPDSGTTAVVADVLFGVSSCCTGTGSFSVAFLGALWSPSYPARTRYIVCMWYRGIPLLEDANTQHMHSSTPCIDFVVTPLRFLQPHW